MPHMKLPDEEKPSIALVTVAIHREVAEKPEQRISTALATSFRPKEKDGDRPKDLDWGMFVAFATKRCDFHVMDERLIWFDKDWIGKVIKDKEDFIAAVTVMAFWDRRFRMSFFIRPVPSKL